MSTASPLIETHGDPSILSTTATTPSKETHSDPSTLSTTTAATPSKQTHSDASTLSTSAATPSKETRSDPSTLSTTIAATLFKETQGDSSTLFTTTAATPSKETHSDPSTLSSTTAAIPSKEIQGDLSTLSTSAATPSKVTHGDPSTLSTSAATPSKETQGDPSKLSTSATTPSKQMHSDPCTLSTITAATPSKETHSDPSTLSTTAATPSKETKDDPSTPLTTPAATSSKETHGDPSTLFTTTLIPPKQTQSDPSTPLTTCAATLSKETHSDPSTLSTTAATPSKETHSDPSTLSTTAATPSKETQGDPSTLSTTAATPSKETQSDPSTPLTTTAATPHRETSRVQNIFDASDAYHAECEYVFEDGQDFESRFQDCKKRSEHANFIPIEDFLNERNGHIRPQDIRDVRELSDRTVRIMVKYVSRARPGVYPDTSIPFPDIDFRGSRRNRRHGTGYIMPKFITTTVKKQCPCPSCKDSRQPKQKYFKVRVLTSAHVVYDDEEARHTVVDLFYNSADMKGVKHLYGITARATADRDHCVLECYTHDGSVAQRFSYIWMPRYTITQSPDHFNALIISHPHGNFKHVTVGQFKHCNLRCRYSKDGRLMMRLPQRPDSDTPNEPVPGAVEVPVPLLYDADYWYYELPEGANMITDGISLPEVKSMIGEIKGIQSYMKPLAGTRIKLPGGGVVDWPDEAEVDSSSKCLQWVYDMSTCPGSSGAPILCLGDGEGENTVMWHLCHMGATSGCNFSSFGFVVYFI